MPEMGYVQFEAEDGQTRVEPADSKVIPSLASVECAIPLLAASV